MIRVVRDPAGAACFDLNGTLPGRGAWVCPSPACVEALTEGSLGHVLRAPVRLAPPDARRRELAAALLRRVGNLLTAARRMRGVTAGPTGVRQLLRAGRVGLLLAAADAPAGALAGADADGPPLRRFRDGAALGDLLGRGPVVVAAVTVGGLATALADAIDRWQTMAGVSCDNGVLQSGIQRARGGSGAAAGGG